MGVVDLICAHSADLLLLGEVRGGGEERCGQLHYRMRKTAMAEMEINDKAVGWGRLFDRQGGRISDQLIYLAWHHKP